MPINPIKEFFKKKKAEVKFARAGPGHTLSAEQSGQTSLSSADQSSSARQAAAEAAMKRFSKDNTKPAQRPRMAQEKDSKPLTNTTAGSGISRQESREVHKQPVVQKELPVIDGVIQRNVQIFSTDELAQRSKQPDIDDDFFRLTVEDAKLFKQRYDEERARNEILKTSEMRRREDEVKKPTTNFARLRFKLPNTLILEASFSGNEPLSLVREWLVENCREKAGLELKNFDILFGLRPFKEADYGSSIKQIGLIPATTLMIVQRNS